MCVFAKIELIPENHWLGFKLILIFIFLTLSIVRGQNIPLNHDILFLNESRNDSLRHTSVKSLNNDHLGYFKPDYDTLSVKNKLFRFLANDNFIHFKDKDYEIIANPILDISLGQSNDGFDDYIFYNRRGFIIQGHIENKLTFGSYLTENLARFPEHIYNYSKEQRVLPLMGKVKGFGEQHVLDYATANGWISYPVLKRIKMEFGHGYHFFGEGYRSLFLSDHSYYYPYFKVTTDLGRLKYINLYTIFQDINFTLASGIYGRKYAGIHYLSYDISDKWNVGLFEAVVWGDSSNTRKFDINYLNPIILYRPIEFSLGSDGGNALMGMHAKYKPCRYSVFYFQFLLDDIKSSELKKGYWKNKHAIQIGTKQFDLFKIKGLGFNTEFNWVKPYTYSHFDGIMNFGHYNSPLAHPYGANFHELNNILRYNVKRMSFKLQFSHTVIGLDSMGSNWGQNIYISYDDNEMDYGNKILQGVNTKLNTINIEFSYDLNPNYFLQFYASAYIRSKKNALIEENNFFFLFGIRTSIFNSYLDIL